MGLSLMQKNQFFKFSNYFKKKFKKLEFLTKNVKLKKILGIMIFKNHKNLNFLKKYGKNF